MAKAKGTAPSGTVVERPQTVVDFSPMELQQVEQLSGYGLNMKEIAAVLGIHPQTFSRHVNKPDSKLRAAVEAGKAKAKGIIGQALYQKASKGDINAIRWWETTRCNYAEKQEITAKSFVLQAPQQVGTADEDEWESEFADQAIEHKQDPTDV